MPDDQRFPWQAMVRMQRRIEDAILQMNGPRWPWIQRVRLGRKSLSFIEARRRLTRAAGAFDDSVEGRYARGDIECSDADLAFYACVDRSTISRWFVRADWGPEDLRRAVLRIYRRNQKQ
jgi:hypothetical protein